MLIDESHWKSGRFYGYLLEKLAEEIGCRVASIVHFWAPSAWRWAWRVARFGLDNRVLFCYWHSSFPCRFVVYFLLYMLCHFFTYCSDIFADFWCLQNGAFHGRPWPRPWDRSLPSLVDPGYFILRLLCDIFSLLAISPWYSMFCCFQHWRLCFVRIHGRFSVCSLEGTHVHCYLVISGSFANCWCWFRAKVLSFFLRHSFLTPFTLLEDVQKGVSCDWHQFLLCLNQQVMNGST